MAFVSIYKRKLLAQSSLDGLTPLLALKAPANLLAVVRLAPATRLKGAESAGHLTPLLAAALAACGGGGSSAPPPQAAPSEGNNPPPPPLPPTPPPNNRHLFDGPIIGATIFVDMDNDGVADDDEPRFGPTDDKGGFHLPSQYSDQQLIAVLDNARDTNRPDDTLNGQWLAPPNSKVISPLTHILATTNIEQADLRKLVGITADIDLTTYNPFANDTPNATDNEVIGAGEMVAAVLAKSPADLLAEVEAAFDEKPTALTLSAHALTLAEGDVTRRKLEDILITDDGRGTYTLRLTAGSDRFEIVGNALYLKAGALDFEAAQTHIATIAFATASGDGTTPPPVTFTLTVTNVDEAPTAFALSDTTLSLEEATSTAQDLATISVTDADGGPHGLALSQTAGDYFVLDGLTLKLAADKTLTPGTHTATLSIAGLPDQTFTLTVTAAPPPPVPVAQSAEVDIHENHPLNKAVYGEGSRYRLENNVPGFQLTPAGKLIISHPPDARNAAGKTIELIIIHEVNDITTRTTYSYTVPERAKVSEMVINKTVLKDFYMIGDEFGTITLTDDYIDNSFFTIDTENRVKWKAVPDYETPLDNGKDNTYNIQFVHTTPDGTETITQLAVTVQDIAHERANIIRHESRRKVFEFTPDDIKLEDLPSDYAQHLLGVKTWAMPDSGPLILTWGLDVERNPDTNALISDPLRLDEVRARIERAFDEFEKYINVQFIETKYGRHSTDIEFRVSSISTGSSASYGSISLTGRDPGNPNYGLILHEIGHVMGLDHPFDTENGWKENDEYKYGKGSELSVMSYNRGIRDNLKPYDIEALQFLYGAPGTNDDGVESLLINTPDYYLI